MSSQDVKLIDGTARSVQEMFMSRSYSIEYYQREYSWTRQNIEELVQDLTRSFINDFDVKHSRGEVATYRPYFLGPVVTFSKDAVRFLSKLLPLELVWDFASKQQDLRLGWQHTSNYFRRQCRSNIQPTGRRVTAVEW